MFNSSSNKLSGDQTRKNISTFINCFLLLIPLRACRELLADLPLPLLAWKTRKHDACFAGYFFPTFNVLFSLIFYQLSAQCVCFDPALYYTLKCLFNKKSTLLIMSCLDIFIFLIMSAQVNKIIYQWNNEPDCMSS